MRISDWSSDVCSSDLDLLADVDVEAIHLVLVVEEGLRRILGVGRHGERLGAHHPVERLARPGGGHRRGRRQQRHGAKLYIRSHRSLSLLLASWPCVRAPRSEEHTSELQSLMSTSYAVFCLKK